MSVRRVIRIVLLSLLGGFLLIQVIPYGRDHTNPPITAEPAWDSPRTRALAAAACFDCHSYETAWPWYTNVAPFSWLTQSDVENGRGTLNFSEWDRPQGEVHETSEAIREGTMPPWYYRILHSGARLTDAERQALIRGLDATFLASPPIEGEHGHESDGD
ncbi:MAG TPA: heme-binding domain-containing protein [Actinomycetota bacterium]|jgi:mono/diheme cytochrome c family protein|nr:heme-binding domain-containing protein [Actinomycetota bacterium]